MKSEILYPGAFPMVRVYLNEGETVKAESGAMVAASPTIDIESKMEGGFLGALSRKMLSGEKFFFQTLRASRGAGEVLLAPTVPGEIVLLDLDGVNEYMVQKDGFLAGAEGVKIVFTPEGPVVKLQCARLELASSGDVAVKCRSFDLQTTEDVRMNGRHILLNCDLPEGAQ